MKSHLVVIAIISLLSVSLKSPAQFLNKLKQKAEQKAEQALDKKIGVNQPSSTNTGSGTGSGSGSSSSSQSPSNNSGGGLISTPPDVKQNLTDAETSYKKSSYGEARYAVQQAMLGVELEIGNQILKSLPASISGLAKIDSEDKVASSGFGWAGLVIERKYNGSKDKQLELTIANNAAWMSAINLYMANGGYAQQTGGEQNWKQTKVKGYKAIIEFDKSSGYKLSVPVGQSSLVVYQGINFATEQDMMKAAAEVDLDGIKKQLGDQ